VPSPARTPAKRRAWGSLSRAEILRVARRVIERDGLEELSLTRLGKQLGAGPTSMYWYFQSKDELLAAVVDDVTQEMYLRLRTIGDGPWDAEIVEHHLAFRRLLQRTPVYRDVFCYCAQTLILESRMSPFILDQLEQGVRLFLGAGLTPDHAVRAHNAFSAYTRAFVLVEEAARQGHPDEAAVQLLILAIARLNRDLAPPGDGGPSTKMLAPDDACFRLGLQLLVDGIRRHYLSQALQ
jgi:AcrR family transcriptional regulator